MEILLAQNDGNHINRLELTQVFKLIDIKRCQIDLSPSFLLRY